MSKFGDKDRAKIAKSKILALLEGLHIMVGVGANETKTGSAVILVPEDDSLISEISKRNVPEMIDGFPVLLSRPSGVITAYKVEGVTP